MFYGSIFSEKDKAVSLNLHPANYYQHLADPGGGAGVITPPHTHTHTHTHTHLNLSCPDTENLCKVWAMSKGGGGGACE